MSTYDELQEWANARAEMETQSYAEMRAETEATLEKAEIVTGLAVIVSFLYALTLVIRAIKKIFRRRRK